MRPPTTIDTVVLGQMLRRNRTRSTPPANTRTNRTAVCPHRASTPPQSGHPNPRQPTSVRPGQDQDLR